MMTKTAKGLVEYAKAQLGKPYWYGTFGQAANISVYNQKKKQYPTYYMWSYPKEDEGVKVHDCVGLIKGYIWCDSNDDKTPVYIATQDKSANGMRDVCKEKGDINTMPEIAGILVFMQHHVGVYIGNGEVIEARGHAYGVVKTKLKGRGWTSWGKCPYITYENNENTTPSSTPTPTPSKNTSVSKNKIDTVVEVQKWLNETYKSGLEVDNIYGRLTRIALTKALQIELGFTGKDVDGICGSKTKAKIKENNLRNGSQGNLVKVLQGFLVCNGYSEAYADGIFGSGTEKSVRKYQEKNGLVVDGICGSGTFDMMCN